MSSTATLRLSLVGVLAVVLLFAPACAGKGGGKSSSTRSYDQKPIGLPPFPMADVATAVTEQTVCGQRVGQPYSHTKAQVEDAIQRHHLSSGSRIRVIDTLFAGTVVLSANFEVDRRKVVTLIRLLLASDFDWTSTGATAPALTRFLGVRQFGNELAFATATPGVYAWCFDEPTCRWRFIVLTDDDERISFLTSEDELAKKLLAAASDQVDDAIKVATTASHVVSLLDAGGDKAGANNTVLRQALAEWLAIKDRSINDKAAAAYAGFRKRWDAATFDQRSPMLEELSTLQQSFVGFGDRVVATAAKWGIAERDELRAPLQAEYDGVPESRPLERLVLQQAINGDLNALRFRACAKAAELVSLKDSSVIEKGMQQLDGGDHLVSATASLAGSWTPIREAMLRRLNEALTLQLSALRDTRPLERQVLQQAIDGDLNALRFHACARTAEVFGAEHVSAVMMISGQLDHCDKLVSATPSLGDTWKPIRAVVVQRLNDAATARLAALPTNRLLERAMLKQVLAGRTGAVQAINRIREFDDQPDLLVAKQTADKLDAVLDTDMTVAVTASFRQKAADSLPALAARPAERAAVQAIADGQPAALQWVELARKVDAATEPVAQLQAMESGEYRANALPARRAGWRAVKQGITEAVVVSIGRKLATVTGRYERLAWESLSTELATANTTPDRFVADGLLKACMTLDTAPDAAMRLAITMRHLDFRNTTLGSRIMRPIRAELLDEATACLPELLAQERHATAAALWLMLYSQHQERWPEPVTVLEHLAGEAGNEPIDRARSLLAAIATRLVPPVDGSTSFSRDLTTIYREGPFAEWPVRWCGGLLLGELDDFRQAVERQSGTKPPMMQLVKLPDEDGYKWAPVGSGPPANWWWEVQREIGDAELQAESDWIHNEKAWLAQEHEWAEAELPTVEQLIAAHNAEIDSLMQQAASGAINEATARSRDAELKARGKELVERQEAYNTRRADYRTRQAAYNARVGPFNERVYALRASYAKKVDHLFRGAVQRYVKQHLDEWEAAYREKHGPGPAIDTEVQWMRWFFGAPVDATNNEQEWLRNLLKPSVANLHLRAELARERIYETRDSKGVGTGFAIWWTAVMQDPTESAATRAEKAKWFVDEWYTRFSNSDFFYKVLMNGSLGDIDLTPLKHALAPKDLEEILGWVRQATGGR